MRIMVVVWLLAVKGEEGDGSSNLHGVGGDPPIYFEVVKLHQFADFHMRDFPLTDELVDRMRTQTEIGCHLVNAHEAWRYGGFRRHYRGSVSS